MCLSLQNATCGERMSTTSEGKANINQSLVKLLEFRHFERFFTFSKSTEKQSQFENWLEKSDFRWCKCLRGSGYGVNRNGGQQPAKGAYQTR